VAPAGFEPAISALRGLRPRPLDDGAMPATGAGLGSNDASKQRLIAPPAKSPRRPPTADVQVAKLRRAPTRRARRRGTAALARRKQIHPRAEGDREAGDRRGGDGPGLDPGSRWGGVGG